MVVRKHIKEARPGEINEWHMIGWLASRLEHDRRLTIDDWNEAVKAARDEKQRSNEALAKYRAELERERE